MSSFIIILGHFLVLTEKKQGDIHDKNHFLKLFNKCCESEFKKFGSGGGFGQHFLLALIFYEYMYKLKIGPEFELNSRSGFEHFGSATGIIILIRMDADPQQ